MWKSSEYDADYMDENQSKYYSKLSGSKNIAKNSSTSTSSSSSDNKVSKTKSKNKKVNKSAARDKEHKKTARDWPSEASDDSDSSASSSDENREPIRIEKNVNKGRDWLVPDLSLLTDEQFQKRLEELRNSHNETLKMCDNLGIKAATAKKTRNAPKAEVDFDYVLRTKREDSSFEEFEEDVGIKKTGKKPVVEPSNDNADHMTPKFSYNPATTTHRCRLSKSASRNGSLYSDSACSLDNCMLDKHAHQQPQQPQRLSDYKGRYTVPQPFNLTPANGLRRSTSFVRFEKDLESRRRNEEAESKKRIKAKPMPEETYELRMERMRRMEERRREENKAARSRYFSAVSQPFNFENREKEKRAMKALDRALASAVLLDGGFKATPYPDRLFGEGAEQRAKEEAWLRWLANGERAEAMLRSSKLPRNMTKERRKHVCELTGDDLEQGQGRTRHYESIIDKNDDLINESRIQREIEADLRSIKV